MKGALGALKRACAVGVGRAEGWCIFSGSGPCFSNAITSPPVLSAPVRPDVTGGMHRTPITLALFLPDAEHNNMRHNGSVFMLRVDR